MLHKFQTHRAPNSSIPEITIFVHIELRKARSTKGMPTMNHYSGNIDRCIIRMLAELTFVSINETTNKSLYLRLSIGINILSLLKEISCWILKFFHLNILLFWTIKTLRIFKEKIKDINIFELNFKLYNN